MQLTSVNISIGMLNEKKIIEKTVQYWHLKPTVHKLHKPTEVQQVAEKSFHNISSIYASKGKVRSTN